MDSTEKPLNGWKEIANFLGVHETTAKTMTGLPKYQRKEGGMVRAYRSELNDYIRRISRKLSEDPPR